MSTKKHIINLFSANLLQIVFSQTGALAMFWLASKELDKQVFGSFNWYFAVYGTAAALLSFGLDFIVTKRVSATNDLNAARLQFLLNAMVTLLSVPALLLAFSSDAQAAFADSAFLLVAFQCTYMGMPFKNALTGREMFSKTASAVVVANAIKIMAMAVLWHNGAVTVKWVALVLAISNFSELLLYTWHARRLLGERLIPEQLKLKQYRAILVESLPQLGVIVFDSAFARIDWILLGAISRGDSSTNTAEYSFAYKLFEVSRLPLLILAPILFTRFTRLLHKPQTIDPMAIRGAGNFFAIGLTAGLTIPLLLNFSWIPVMQFFTDGKYGPENRHIYLLLSSALPFIYLINYLWTMAFAQGQLRLTMILSVCNSVANIVLNLILIPPFGQTGAAIAFLACNVLMAPVYWRFVDTSALPAPIAVFAKLVTAACITGIATYLLPLPALLQAVIACLLFVLLVFLSKILTFEGIVSLKHFLKRT